MIALLSASTPPPTDDLSIERERAEHSAFLLVWQIIGTMIPAYVLFLVLRRAFKALRQRWKTTEARKRGEVVEEKKRKKRGWVLVDSQSEESGDVSSSETEEVARQPRPSPFQRIRQIPRPATPVIFRYPKGGKKGKNKGGGGGGKGEKGGHGKGKNLPAEERIDLSHDPALIPMGIPSSTSGDLTHE